MSNDAEMIHAYEAEARYSVHRSTIGRWLKAGKLAFELRGKRKYFRVDEFLIVAGKSQTQADFKPRSPKAPKDKGAKKPRAGGPAPGGTPAPEEPSDNYPTEDEDLDLDKISRHGLDKMRVGEDVLKKRQDRLTARRSLIPQALLSDFLRGFYGIHVNQLRPMGAKIAPEICAVIGSTNPEDENKIAQVIDAEIYPILDYIKQEAFGFLEAEAVKAKK